METTSRENTYPDPLPGIPMLIVGIVCLLTVFGIPIGLVILRGLVLVNPNQAKVVLLFGNYKGTLRRDGLFWINPLAI